MKCSRCNLPLPLVFVACNSIITVTHVLIECADLAEVRKKSVYLPFPTVNPEKSLDFLGEIVVYYKI